MGQIEKPRDYNPYIGKDLSVLLILCSLKTDEYSSTYDIIKNIKKQTNGKISFRAGTIYPQMVKLEELGLLDKRVVDTPSRSKGVTRQKSIYSLTPKGLEVLKEKTKDWADIRQIIDDLTQDIAGGELHE